MSTAPVYILGGHQTDFARNAARAGDGLFELMREAVQGALAEGERVVTSGAGFLNDGASVRVVSQAAETGAATEIVR